MIKTPKAVLISDIHFTLYTLELATAALVQAIKKAKDLGVPLFIAGDLIDSKAIIRGEVANRLIEIFTSEDSKGVMIIVLVGNHDRIHEKNEAHSLTFLKPYVHSLVEDTAWFDSHTYLMAYHSSAEMFKFRLSQLPPGTTAITHQGFKGFSMGEYYKDDSSMDVSAYKDLRIIGGHYHQHATIGNASYIGSPYSITHGEANDGPKGFCILYTDGSLEQIPTNLRKHVKVERTHDTVLDPIPNLNPVDLLWLKVIGPYTELEKLDKKAIGLQHLGHSNYKLEKSYVETVQSYSLGIQSKDVSTQDLLDKIIDNTSESDKVKQDLKQLWRELA